MKCVDVSLLHVVLISWWSEGGCWLAVRRWDCVQ